MNKWLHLRFIYRQLTAPASQILFFVGCVCIAIMSVVALEGWSTAIRRTLFDDTRQLHGGDIIIRSYYPFTHTLERRLDRLKQSGQIDHARYYELYTIVQAKAGGGSLLCRLKAVEVGYPLYGDITLKSKGSFAQSLPKGTVIVGRSLLERLKISVGSHLTIGGAPFRIADVVVREPDQPVSVFSLGPRVFMNIDDLASLNLIQLGSRVRYVALVKVADDNQLESMANTLRKAALQGQEQVTTYRAARSRIKQFWDRFLLFLKLVNLFTVLVAGMGIHSALAAFFRNNVKTIAILKAIGATRLFIWINFLVVVFIWGGVGIALGLAGGILLQHAYPLLWGNLVPLESAFIISWPIIGEGIFLGLVVIGLFAYLPLVQLKHVKPLAIIRQTSTRRFGLRSFAMAMGGIILFVGLAVGWWSTETRIGIYYFIGIMSFLIIIGLCTQLVHYLMRKLSPRRLALRLALKGLFRPMNATRTIMTTLTAALTLIFTLYLLETTMARTFDSAMPPTASNLYFIDIQPSQVQALKQLLGPSNEFYPVIRARLTSMNGQKINRQQELRRLGDNLAREFNLTYRHHLLKDEYLLQGQTLFTPGGGSLQVSVLQKVARIGNIQLGDQLGFNIQGIPIEVEVSSIRARNMDSFEPYFYFVFPKTLLEAAPHTFFTAAHLPPDKITEIQAQMAEKFPNISVINLSETLARFTSVLGKLGKVLRFIAIFCLSAGFLIIISAFMATRLTRIKEIVYYKVLGANEHMIIKIYALESALIAVVSVSIAFLIANAATAILSFFVFDLAYQPVHIKLSALAFLFVMGVSLLGIITTRPISKYRPMRYLRNQEE